MPSLVRWTDGLTWCTSKRVCILSLFLSLLPLPFTLPVKICGAGALPVCLVTEIMASRRQGGSWYTMVADRWFCTTCINQMCAMLRDHNSFYFDNSHGDADLLAQSTSKSVFLSRLDNGRRGTPPFVVRNGVFSRCSCPAMDNKGFASLTLHALMNLHIDVRFGGSNA